MEQNFNLDLSLCMYVQCYTFPSICPGFQLFTNNDDWLNFWKCNFPMNHNVCLSVGQSVQKKLSEFLYVQILGKCRLLLLLLKNPPLQLKQVIDVIKVENVS